VTLAHPARGAGYPDDATREVELDRHRASITGVKVSPREERPR
jgi:hypothetical protein